jgi:hypothetical protein
MAFTESAFINLFRELDSTWLLDRGAMDRLEGTFRKPTATVTLSGPARELLQVLVPRTQFVGADTRQRFSDFMVKYTGMAI